MKAFKSTIICSIFLGLLGAQSGFAGLGEGGGHDGGGGTTTQSSNAEVREAVEWAMGEIREDRAAMGPSWLFFAAIYGPRMRPEPGEVSGRPIISCLNHPSHCQRGGTPLSGSAHAWDYLELSPVVFQEEACPAPEKSHAAASVSAHEVGATLCFSYSELRKIPASALRREAAALLAHEMSHLLGFDEDIAVQVQLGVAANFGSISRNDGSHLVYQLRVSMLRIDSALYNAASLTTEGDMTSGIFLLGEVSGAVSVILNMLPDGINDRTIPAVRPELERELRTALSRLQNQALELSSKAPRMKDQEYDLEIEKLRKHAQDSATLLRDFFGQ